MSKQKQQSNSELIKKPIIVKDGLARFLGHDPIVRIGRKYGYISAKTGEPLTPVKYDKAENWTQIIDLSSTEIFRYMACVKLGGKWGCINSSGEEIVPIKYEEIVLCGSLFDDEDPRIMAKLNGKWGFVSENGVEVTAFEYDEVAIFREGRARVKNNNKYGFIDNKGKIVISLEYDDCEPYFFKQDGNS